MKDSEIIKKLPHNTKKILEYLGYVNDKSNPLHATLGAIYLQASRYACWNRCYLDGLKGLEPPSLYFVNFAKSGAYKDEIMRTIADVNKKPLSEQRDKKNKWFELMEMKYNDGLKCLKNSDKAEYKENNKVVRWRNTYSGGTVQGMYIDRKGMFDAGFGALHFEHSEVMDLLGKKDSTAKEIMEIMKDVFPKGNSKSETTASSRRVPINNVPMTMFLHGVSSGLKENKDLMDMLIYILESGMAKRSYVFFDTKHRRAKLTFDELELNEIEAAMLRPDIEDIFYNAYKAVELTGVNGNYKQYKVIKLGDGVKRKMNEYRNLCIDKEEVETSKVLKAEVTDRHWKSLRLATAIALIEHPKKLIVTLDDYNIAGILTEHWGRQFKEFLKDKTQPLHYEVYNYILNNPKCSKMDIRNALKFGTNPSSTKLLDSSLEVAFELAEENGNAVKIEKNGRGTKYEFISNHLIDVEKYNDKKCLSSINLDDIDI